MKPLVTNKNVLTWLCILPAQEQTNKRMKLIYIAFTFTLSITCFCGLASSLAFMMEYLSTNLENCLYALFQVAADASAFYMVMVALFLRHKMAALFDNLSEIYNKSTI